jgi:transposase
MPLQECSPNKRSRVVSARDHVIKWPIISRMENLSESTCRSIVKRAPQQTSCITQPRSGRPVELTERHHRKIWRALAINPKITAANLVRECDLPVKKKTVYRYLKKSGIQKWRCRKRPLLTPERAAARLAWALKYDNMPVEFWQRWRWSDECSIERGKGGKWDFVYRRWGKNAGLNLLCHLVCS